MRIGELRSARTPHQGQEGKDIVALDRWAEDRTEGAVSSPGIGIMKVPEASWNTNPVLGDVLTETFGCTG